MNNSGPCSRRRVEVLAMAQAGSELTTPRRDSVIPDIHASGPSPSPQPPFILSLCLNPVADRSRRGLSLEMPCYKL